MPTTMLNHITNQPRPNPNRGVLGLKLGPSTTKHIHSPDGYFGHEDAFRALRAVQPSDAAFIRRRSKGHIVNAECDSPVLQDVQEEEDTSSEHTWRRPSRHDSRSPCPALNTLSNHAYLPRDGRNIGIWAIVLALREGYGASWALAICLTVVSFVILRLGGVGKGWLHPTIDLEDLAAHDVLEHHGSLTHADAGEEPDSVPSLRSRSRSSSTSSTAVSTTTTGSFFSLSSLLTSKPAHVYTSCRPSRILIRALLADSASGTHLTLSDVARARVRREATTGRAPRLLSRFADGEFAMTLGFFNTGPNATDPRVELGVLREWLEDERLPQGWRPDHVQGLWQTHLNTDKVQKLMEGVRKYGAKKRLVRSVVYE